jgi:predicted PhzF superfamily epimerase YddE/YHI9
MIRLHVLRVFTDEAGRYGNPLGVVLDGAAIPEPFRQHVAALLGFSETVFAEAGACPRIRIYTPAVELPFAGHAVLGMAWLLRQERGCAGRLLTRAGEIEVRADGDLLWIRSQPAWCPPWQHVQLGSAAEVAGATGSSPGHDAVQVWAFEDAASGRVRARVFAARFGVKEDEACGSASILLAARLGRPLVIRHGTGSQIYARPAPGGTVDLGGRTVMAEIRHTVPVGQPPSGGHHTLGSLSG